jgi:hypothetical protein
LTTAPLVGGISKWSAQRFDLLARDAACAAADRAANARGQAEICPESALTDVTQVLALRTQMLEAAGRAVADGDLDAGKRRRLQRLAAKVRRAPARQPALRYHRKAARVLGRACRLFH